MSTRIVLTTCLVTVCLSRVAWCDDVQEVQRLKEENLKLRAALAAQQKQLLETEDKAAVLARQAEELRKLGELMKEESLKLRETLAAQQKRLLETENKAVELARQADDLRKLRTQAEIETAAYKARSERQELQLRELTKEMARLKAGVAPLEPQKGNGEKTPEEQIEGRVVQVDEKGGFFTISIGSDVGLKQGHTLQVYRLDAVPDESKYLGTLEVLSVMPTKAVARMRGKPLLAVRAGDRVASRLLTPDKK